MQEWICRKCGAGSFDQRKLDDFLSGVLDDDIPDAVDRYIERNNLEETICADCAQ